jgi:hypothetical protein
MQVYRTGRRVRFAGEAFSAFGTQGREMTIFRALLFD